MASIPTSDELKCIAQYKFNSDIDTLPIFNTEFVYTYKDIDNGDGTTTRTMVIDALPISDTDFVYTHTDVDNGDGTTTRTITSNSIPNSISFMNCAGLLEVYDLDLGNLANLDYLFYGCYELTYIDTSKIKSNAEITSLNYAFSGCEKLAGELDLSKLNVKITSGLDGTFWQCSCLTSINLNGWDISEVYSMYATFEECTNLRTLNIDGWNFTNVAMATNILLGTDALSTISIQNSIADSIYNFIYFALPQRTNTGNVLNIRGIDNLDSLIESGTVSYAESCNWEVVYDVIDKPETPSGTIIAQYKFNSSIDTLPTFNSGFTYEYTDVNNGDGTITRTITSESRPTSISFNGETGLVSVSYLDTSNLTSMQSMFYGCDQLTTLDVSGWNTDNVTTIETMFAYCSSLVTITGLNELNVSRVDNMGGLFTDCSNLTEIDVSNWDVSKVTNFGAVFRRCPKLTNIDVSKWDTSSGVIMSGIFTNCSGLIEIDLSSWDMSHANSVSQMFYGCSSLMKLKMCANLNQDAVTTYWLGRCNSLIDVQLTDFDVYTINKVIDELPTRNANGQGSLIIPKMDDSINTSTADSKYWIVSPDPTNIRQIHLGGITISNLYIGEVGVKKVYLGETIIYENKQAVADKDILYNEFTGTLFILKEDAYSYDEKELALNINSDIINVSYNEENLNIGGDK